MVLLLLAQDPPEWKPIGDIRHREYLSLPAELILPNNFDIAGPSVAAAGNVQTITLVTLSILLYWLMG